MRNRRNFQRGEEENFWPSFTDMISTIALILFFLMLIAFINNIITGKNLEFAKKQLIDTEKRLEESRAEISNAEADLRLLQDELEDTMAEVEAGQIALSISERQIEEQRKIIADSNEELGQLRSRLQGIAILRLDLLQKVKDSIEENIGTSGPDGEPLVSISDNGNIVLNNTVLFEIDSAELNSEGKKLLSQLAIAFENVLEDGEVRNFIDAISIQGHTDANESGIYNRNLSADRATNVVNYMMQSNPDLQERYGRYFAASAYSEYRPIDPGTSPSAYQKNRRIEISVILKDSNVQNVIDEYLEDVRDLVEDANENQEEAQ